MTDTQAMTLRLPQDIHEKLREAAFVTRRPMNEIAVEGIAHRLGDITPEQYGLLCGLFEAAWHHVVPESLDDVAPMTSNEARALALLADQVMNS